MIRTIHQVELSSRCNLRCQYCPHPKMKRAKQDMDWPTFRRTIALAKHLGGPELSLTGMGEAMLHPDFCEMARYARNELPDMWFLLATNGICLTKDTTGELVQCLKECRISVYVSTHRPEIAGKAIEILCANGVQCSTNTAFVTSGFDWAGQADWHGVKAPPSKCQYIAQQWGCVLADGTIVNCCMDAEGLHPAGHVNDPLPTLSQIPLCQKCHLIP